MAADRCRYLGQKPTEKELNIVADNVGSNCKSLLSNLGLPLNTIERIICDNHPNIRDACHKGLVLWLHGEGSEPCDPRTYGTLFVALEESQMKHCIRLLLDELNERSGLPHDDVKLSAQRSDLSSIQRQPDQQQCVQPPQRVQVSPPRGQPDRIPSNAIYGSRESSPSPVQPLPTPQHRHSTPPALLHSETPNQRVFQSDLARSDQQRSEKMPDLLFGMYHASPVTIGRNVYLAGGITSDGATAKRVLVYNVDNEACSLLPAAPQYNSQAVAIQGNLVLVGGKVSSDQKITNLLSTWLIGEERWTQVLPPMKVKRFRPGVFLLESLLFVFGGKCEDDISVLDTFEVLDLDASQPQWMEGRGCLPEPMYKLHLELFGDRVMLTSAMNSERKAIATCYTVSVSDLKASVVDSPSSPIPWKQVADAPNTNSALLTTSREAVLIGGNNSHSRVPSVDIHCFSSGSWQLIGKLSQPRMRPVAVADSDRSFIVLGGNTDPRDSFKSIVKTVERVSYNAQLPF